MGWNGKLKKGVYDASEWLKGWGKEWVEAGDASDIAYVKQLQNKNVQNAVRSKVKAEGLGSQD